MMGFLGVVAVIDACDFECAAAITGRQPVHFEPTLLVTPGFEFQNGCCDLERC